MIGLATGGLVAAVWQGILLAAAVGLGLRLLPKTPAAVRFAIWFAVFVVVTALPAVSLWLPAAGAARTVVRGAWLTLDARWSLAIAAVWAVASLVRAGTLMVAALQVRTLWKRAMPVVLEGASGLRPTLRDTTAKYGAPGVYRVPGGFWGRRRVQICTSEEVDRPTVIGFFAPKILIPGWLLEKLTAAELEQIVLHEAGHLGRADDWMNLLQKVALVVFPLNPALAWVERRLCFERELAVDERVLRTTQAPKAYAACLATLAEHRLGRRGLALALGALGRESELGRRVRRILRRGEGMKPLQARLVLGGAMLGLVAGAVGLERCPRVVGFAQESGQTVAQGVQRQPTHGDETAMNGAPDVRMSAVRIASPNNHMPRIQNVMHEGLLLAPDWSGRQNGLAGSRPVKQRPPQVSAVGSVRMIRTMAPDFGVHGGPKPVSDVEPSQSATGVMQWVVVTTWQSEDGSSRVVLTTARAVSAAGAVSDGPEATGDSPELRQQQPQQFYPYAAVPVRGGWLVFQL